MSVEDLRAIDERFMRRALQLAECGCYGASPNPMVGSVIVDASGRIIGEGYHRRCGGPHAEVNAVNSVRDKSLLPGSTIYVTLEPCAHYGKTPPCADLIVRSRFHRVVIGCRDPFAKVDGQGIARIRDAGIDVTVGVLEEECRQLNEHFMTAHTLHRPYVLLKWACSADGYLARVDPCDPAATLPVAFSTPLTKTLVHCLRERYDAIVVGRRTVVSDNPRLDCRMTGGRAPRPVVFSRSGKLPEGSILAGHPDLIIASDDHIAANLGRLYSEYGITSLMVEGGAELLASFIESGCWDAARMEIAPFRLGEEGRGRIMWQHIPPESIREIDGRQIVTVRNGLNHND